MFTLRPDFMFGSEKCGLIGKWKREFKALSATGLRAIRYEREVEVLGQVNKKELETKLAAEGMLALQGSRIRMQLMLALQECLLISQRRLAGRQVMQLQNMFKPVGSQPKATFGDSGWFSINSSQVPVAGCLALLIWAEMGRVGLPLSHSFRGVGKLSLGASGSNTRISDIALNKASLSESQIKKGDIKSFVSLSLSASIFWQKSLITSVCSE
ncbi:hypothetical protein Tco_0409758 [Tanacetum coccineum]